MVDLSTYPFELEPVYFNQGLSPDSRQFTRKTIAEKLVAIQDALGSGHRFKIWDSWRSCEVQNNIFQNYWSEVSSAHPDWNEQQLREQVETFVSRADNDHRIPPHASGGAIDLTLVDASGTELSMGTEFDHFGPEAASLYYEEFNRIAD